jgi:hypothetical protein
VTKHFGVWFIAVVAGLGLCFAQSKEAKTLLTNDDIIQMSRAGVPQSTIVASIESSSVKFDVTPAALIALHEAGVSEAVLNQMIRSGAPHKGPTFGVATATFPVKDAAGKTVRYSAWIKTENVTDGYAGIWWRVDGKESGKVLAFDNSEARIIEGSPADGDGVLRAATGTTDWKRYEFELPVSADARNINFGLLFTGKGTAWFDGLRVELNGVPYMNSQPFDLDFEGSKPRGFYTGGEGYVVALDSTMAWSGAQSLKMQSAQR